MAERYRRLPGRRRGFLFGSSVWLGSDHLLLVKSERFREEYRRFYFRDIQAVVTAKAPRFHISTRSALIAWLWLVATGVLAGAEAGAGRSLLWISWVLAAGLVFVWAYLSVFCSCRCRILTAVSSEELRSVYRSWTARRFMEKVEPLLTQVQGAIEGSCAEAVDDKQIGPVPEGRIGVLQLAAAESAGAGPAIITRTPLAMLFVASLCLGGLANLVALGVSEGVGRWVLIGFLLLEVSATVAATIQGFLGKLHSSLRNLAIVSIACLGISYWAAQMVAGMAVAFRTEKSTNPNLLAPQMQGWALLGHPLARGTAGSISVLLGAAGVILLLRGERPPEEKVTLNV